MALGVERGRSGDVGTLFAGLRPLLVGVGAFTVLVNMLMLTGAFYMLQVYDRVIPSRSLATLVALSVLALSMFAVQGVLDALRGRLLVRLGAVIDERLAGTLFARQLRARATYGLLSEPASSLRDLEQVRAFLSSAGPCVLFDLPWIPLYVGLCFLLHPWLGVTALSGGLIIIALTIWGEWRTRQATREATQRAGERGQFIEQVRDAAEGLVALGMAERLGALFAAHNRAARGAQVSLATHAADHGALSRTFRMLLQSLMLGTGALLVIEGQASGGVMIAASILMSRALAPVELAVAHWRGLSAARDAWARLRPQIAGAVAETAPLALPLPKAELDIQNLAVAAPGGRTLLVQGISLRLVAGEAVGVIGPSGSGKSTLARAVANLWPLAGGHIRLDGARLDNWQPDRLGTAIGYLPQDVTLLDGTVAQNIARFTPGAPDQAVIAAATAAGVHDMILRLANGYDTRVGVGGAVLSTGQRQRVALARALYGDPFLVVLDEPNAHLDVEGEAALAGAINAARARGAVVMVIAHRLSALQAVTHLLAMQNGRVAGFGSRDEMMRKLMRPTAVPNQAAPNQAASNPVVPAAVKGGAR
ncbi:MAG TPA: type I secretion system permease/ATPase [Xanthobacteraceae bacterium]|nr:type I secretion system permease/ATPase [Xanthobacteraceae bacterium]